MHGTTVKTVTYVSPTCFDLDKVIVTKVY